MYDSFRALFGNVTVKETATEIVISGIRAKEIIRDMDKFWKTTKITSNMFNVISSGTLTFYKFFAPEVMYMLENIKLYRNRWTSIKAINAIREAMLENTWLKNTVIPENPANGRLDFKRLNNMTFTAEKYQMEYFQSYNTRLDQYGLKGDLCAAAAGVGKTYLSSAIAEMLGAEVIVVFMPKSVLETTWIPSVQEMFKEAQSVWSSDNPKPYNGERWILCHYDYIKNLGGIIDQLGTAIANKKVVTILDESHNLNDPNSARSLAYLDILKTINSDNNILMSGTPVKALGAEIITLLRAIDPMFTPKVEEKFRKMYGKEASKGLDIIRHRLGLVSYKIEKSETKLLPPIMRDYPIKIPNGGDYTLPMIRKYMEEFIKERAEYYRKRRPEDEKFWAYCIDTLTKANVTKDQRGEFGEYLRMVGLISSSPDPRFLGEEMKWCNRYEKEVFEKVLPQRDIARFRDVKSVIKYTHLKIQGEVLGRIVGGKRIEAHVAMVPFIDWVGIVESTSKKTIVFTTFVEAVDASAAHTAKLGMVPLVVYGKTNSDLAGIVTRYDQEAKLNPLIATYASLSTGVRLTMADTMITLNAPFRAYILEQAIARIYRLGQDSQTYVYKVILDTGDIPNISTRSADILQWSTDQVAAILGISATYQEGDVYTGLEEWSKTNNIYDENKILHHVLQKSFEQYDIVINEDDFKVPSEAPKMVVPAWMR